MAGVSGLIECPVCGQKTADYYLETKTNEEDTHCRTCGYFSERRIVNLKGQLFMERTECLPMTHQGVVVGSPWNAEMMAKPEGCNCYGCQRPDEAKQ